MSINGWHSLQYSTPSAVLNGYLKSGVLCAIWEWMKVEIGTVIPICGLQKLSEASFICLVQLRIVLKHFISNGCVSVWYNIPFAFHLPYWVGTNILYFGCNLRVGFGRKWHNETHELQAYAMRCASHLSCTSKDGLETLHEQWIMDVSRCSISSHLPYWEGGTKNSGILCTIWESVLVEMALCDL